MVNLDISEMSSDFRPNIKKILLKSIFNITIAFIVIVSIPLFLKKIIDIDTLMIPLDLFEIEINKNLVLYYFIAVVFVIVLLSLLLSYISFAGVHYTFFKNRIRIYRSIAIILVNSNDISYENFFRVSVDKNGFFNNLFNVGSIIIELTGMKEKQIKMEFIDRPADVCLYIQKLVKNYRQMDQAKFDEKHKFSSIVNQL